MPANVTRHDDKSASCNSLAFHAFGDDALPWGHRGKSADVVCGTRLVESGPR